MTFSLLIITILTLVFGVLAYFMYKIRESMKKVKQSEESYEEILEKSGTDFFFLRQESKNVNVNGIIAHSNE